MKRDLELCRQIMLRLEAAQTPPGVIGSCEPGLHELDIEGWLPDEIGYNADLLARHGLLNDHSGMDNGHFYFSGISWEGHDYLDAVRDPEVWSKTISGAAKLGSWTFDIVKDIAVGYVRQKAHELGLPL